jgi:beta-lactam-binding protein with PASTA domain
MINFQKIAKNKFFRHISAMLLLVVICVWVIFYSINIFTKHGETITVPELYGIKTTEIESFLAERDLNFKIIDSIYDNKRERGVVLEQDPLPDSQVKEGRTIYITVNAFNPVSIPMPTLIDLSQRQALAVLESYGLKLGALSYIPDACRNCVIKQLYKGKDIQAGSPIEKGSKIDLVLGRGESEEKVSVPNVLGLTVDQAIKILQEAFLNIGAEVYDQTIQTSADSVRARVYKQSPIRMEGYPVSLGSPIDVWLTLDTNLINQQNDFESNEEDFNN